MCFCLKEIAVFLFKLGWLGYDVCPRISLPRKRGRSWPGGWGVRHWERGTAQGEAVRAQACGLQSRMRRNSCAEAGREPKIFIYGIYFYQEKKKKSAPLWRKDESHLWDLPKLDSQCCQWTEWTICQPFSSYKTYFNLLFPNIIANQFPSMIATACKGVSHQLVVFVYFNWGSLKFTRIIHSPNHKSEVPTVEKLGLVAGNKVKLVRLN